ncbi:MAG TPA: DNA-formamidopyrimidine glycosylase family protein [Actinomycetota bacterium]|nr:DNA-formamidopyrimidine glycosylase family protein [Actinomycetota bacterium]
MDSLLAGATLGTIVPLQFSAAKTFDLPASAVEGTALRRVGRRGKYLVFEFDGPRLLIHLSQGGRLEVEAPPKKTRPKGAVLRLLFEERPALLIREYGSHRKAGWWLLAVGDDGPLARLGPEPFSAEFENLITQGDDKRHIHSLLRDQRTVAGIGRGFSDDILHHARLSPYVSLARLDRSDRATLIASVHEVLSEALKRERRRTGGLPTKLGERFAIHGRAGRPCPRCGADIRRVSFEDYEIAYCPQCQTEGRVLADRRMSRLIR